MTLQIMRQIRLRVLLRNSSSGYKYQEVAHKVRGDPDSISVISCPYIGANSVV